MVHLRRPPPQRALYSKVTRRSSMSSSKRQQLSLNSDLFRRPKTLLHNNLNKLKTNVFHSRSQRRRSCLRA